MVGLKVGVEERDEKIATADGRKTHSRFRRDYCAHASFTFVAIRIGALWSGASRPCVLQT